MKSFAMLLRGIAWITIFGSNAFGANDLSEADAMYQEFLAGPMKDVQEIIFAERGDYSDPHWYADVGYYCTDPNKKFYCGGGGRLSAVNIRTGKTRTLLEDRNGSVRDPQVHYDGKKVLFAYRKGGTDYYHLYEIQADGSGLRQLTDGPFDDYEPTYLADRGIVFNSTRCRRYVPCMLSHVANLHRANGDGSGIRPLSSNTEMENSPWPLPDGRILFMRWEYVDRNQLAYHHLWTVNPDGTGQMVFFGNQNPFGLMIDAKPIPGSRKVVVAYCRWHGSPNHVGDIAVIDPRKGPDDLSAVRYVNGGQNSVDPWAFSEECIMASDLAAIYVMNSNGLRREIVHSRGIPIHEPRPLVPRPREFVISSRIQPKAATATLLLADVYRGRNMSGIKRGEIKKLLVLEQLPKPVNFSGYTQPISFCGTYLLERILGTVPVEPDGSAQFEVPPMRSLFFVALDENGLSVKRMQSFVTLMPGETTGCVGCHESRTSGPPESTKNDRMAFRRSPSKIEAVKGVPDLINFPKDIQPIFDRHCLKCHDDDHRDGRLTLSGDHGPFYSLSYFELTFAKELVSHGRNLPQGNYPPRGIGSSASRLMRFLEPLHHGVKLSALESRTIQLWIDSGATYTATYAALGTGMFAPSAPREDIAWPSTRAAAEAIGRRCGNCHAKETRLPMSVSDDYGQGAEWYYPFKEDRHDQWHTLGVGYQPWDDVNKDPRHRFSNHLVFNLTRPEKSLMLLAPLAKAEGGFGVCRMKSADARPLSESPEIFASTSDPDFQKILAMIAQAKTRLDEIKRFDMPGFYPRQEWVREMKRYGVLPATFELGTPLNIYDTERKYWELFWPQTQESNK
jgi:hypothetical protein